MSTASLLSSDEKCDGTIILKHSSAESLGDYQKLYLSEKDQYRNIRKKFNFLLEILSLQNATLADLLHQNKESTVDGDLKELFTRYVSFDTE